MCFSSLDNCGDKQTVTVLKVKKEKVTGKPGGAWSGERRRPAAPRAGWPLPTLWPEAISATFTSLAPTPLPSPSSSVSRPLPTPAPPSARQACSLWPRGLRAQPAF